MKFFWIWAALRRHLQEPLVLHENVESFGTDLLADALGDLYYIVRTHDDICNLGWAGYRVRQIVILMLKSWVGPIWKACPHLLDENADGPLQNQT